MMHVYEEQSYLGEVLQKLGVHMMASHMLCACPLRLVMMED